MCNTLVSQRWYRVLNKNIQNFSLSSPYLKMPWSEHYEIFGDTRLGTSRFRLSEGSVPNRDEFALFEADGRVCKFERERLERVKNFV
jgi:hypothetical protein